MGAFDKLFPGLAATLLGVFGTTAVLRQLNATYVASTGDKTVTTVDYAINCSAPKPATVFQANGDTIQQGDLFVDVQAQGLAIAPAPGKFVFIFNGQTYNIISAGTVLAGAAPVKYQLQCRK
jgi:hypothetical protein